MHNQPHTFRVCTSRSQSCLQSQMVISLKNCVKEREIMHWEMVSRLTTHGNYIRHILISKLFYFIASFISHISVHSFSAIFIPSFLCPASAYSLVFTLHTLIFYLLLHSLLFLLLLLLFLLILFLLQPILPYRHLSSSQRNLIFSFLLPTLLLLLTILYFIVNLSFCPLLLLFSTSVLLYIFPLNLIFILQSFFLSYSLIFIFFRLNFSSLSLRHLFLFSVFS